MKQRNKFIRTPNVFYSRSGPAFSVMVVALGFDDHIDGSWHKDQYGDQADDHVTGERLKKVDIKRLKTFMCRAFCVMGIAILLVSTFFCCSGVMVLYPAISLGNFKTSRPIRTNMAAVMMEDVISECC